MVYILLIIRIGYVDVTYVRCSSINRKMLLAFLYDVKKCLLDCLIFFRDSRSPHMQTVCYIKQLLPSSSHLKLRNFTYSFARLELTLQQEVIHDLLALCSPFPLLWARFPEMSFFLQLCSLDFMKIILYSWIIYFFILFFQNNFIHSHLLWHHIQQAQKVIHK